MITAIVLSAGKGTRMNSAVAKQYLELKGRPVLYYPLKAFEDSLTDEIVIVTGKEDIEYVQREIVDRYDIKKVRAVVAGGEYRFSSVYNGLIAADENTEYVFIHDGARPLVTPEMIEKLYNEVKEKKAVVAACPAKDTIKVVDESGRVVSTPPRSSLWQVQTPQTFEYKLVKSAYNKLMESGDVSATDDAMVVETYGEVPVYLIDTGYSNIKITTPEDMKLAEVLLEMQNHMRVSTGYN